MTKIETVIKALQEGPKTNDQLAKLIHSSKKITCSIIQNAKKFGRCEIVYKNKKYHLISQLPPNMRKINGGFQFRYVPNHKWSRLYNDKWECVRHQMEWLRYATE